ncbi:ABC transporter permease [Tengunoibacter tsumagoiensis]|uniref:ABC3 transporter permease C-terminal domain-containing protein n=1 Tax=Tengunoibacter tsumagoiensis TaxID=2014871 RepID=A0A401ZWT7_9CHLR|nr:FtsX-like permease family protein [Tengunoibacter tsumagoiensis]GCE11240.1 hypothetical protein KTT_10990 [Tengunoibacter tsumagoiensis]
MSAGIPRLRRQGLWRMIPSIVRLTGWRFKRTWFLLVMVWLSLLVSVMLVCAIPLFSRVAITASIRSYAQTVRQDSDLQISLGSTHISDRQIQNAEQFIAQHMGTTLSSYIKPGPTVQISSPGLQPVSDDPAINRQVVNLQALDSTTAASQWHVVQGRFPSASATELEVAFTSSAARAFNLRPGSVFEVSLPENASFKNWRLSVVGIADPKPQTVQGSSSILSGSGNNIGLVSLPALIAKANTMTFTSVQKQVGAISPTQQVLSLADSPHQETTASLAHASVRGTTVAPLHSTVATTRTQSALSQRIPVQKYSGGIEAFQIQYHYAVNYSQIDVDTVGALEKNIQKFSSGIYTDLPQEISDIQYASVYGGFLAIESFTDSTVIALEITQHFLLFLLFGLALFLVNMFSHLLVEQQAASIAVMRSRGATRRHVFGIFVPQLIGSWLLALIVGAFLTIGLVTWFAQFLLAPEYRNALNVITDRPVYAIQNVGWFALVMVFVTLFVMLIAVYRATNLNILTMRRESARSQHVPFWKKFYLDLILALLLLLIFGAYLYVLHIYANLNEPPGTSAEAFAMITLFVLVFAVLLLFLRIFPWLLRLSTKLVARRRGATGLLSLAQMERAPRVASRMILLLTLSISLSSFFLTMIATEQQNAKDTGTFLAIGDFGGSITPDHDQTLSSLQKTYSHIPGVTSATLGYIETKANPIGGPTTSFQINAVDADTYAQTAYWLPQYSKQSLADLTQQMVVHRSNKDRLYGVVNRSIADSWGVSPGSTFKVGLPGMNEDITVSVLAIADHLPGCSTLDGGTDEFCQQVLVDYQSYASWLVNRGQTIQPDHLWLRTDGSETTRERLHTQFPDLLDRQDQVRLHQNGPLQADIQVVFFVGIVLSVLLALLGTIFSSWLSARNRLASFSIMRALGMDKRQVSMVLFCEQSLIYCFALIAGTGLGYLMTIFASPIVGLMNRFLFIDSGWPARSLAVLPVMPWQQLGMLLGIVILLSIVALLLMARIVSHPKLAQALRLNED